MPMSRKIHFVGSLPPEVNPSPRAGMSWVAEHSHGHSLSTLPWDDDDRWIVAFLLSLAERDDVFVTAKPGDWSDYDQDQRYKVRRGVKLQPEHVSMRRAERIRSTLATYRELLAEHPEYAKVPHQESLPSPLDLSLFAFGQRPAFLRHVKTFAEALAAEVADLHATDGDTLVWQLEAPTVLVMINKVPRPLRGIAARLMAKQIAAFTARLPLQAQLILHLCYGNLNDTELVTPKDFGGVDVFLNALRKRLRAQGRALPPVHIPAAYGTQPPPVRADFYTALSRVHPDWELVAGVVDENDPDSSQTALTLFEAAAGRTSYAVATACGLGRHNAKDAAMAADLMIQLADAEPSDARQP